MTDIVTRLRDWRNVHLARLHLLMEEAADEMERLSANGDCPVADNGANEDNDERLAALRALTAVDEELGMPRRTPDTLATPSHGIEQNWCTLTDAERVSLRSENTAIYENPNAPTLTDEERAAVERAADLIDAKTCGDSATLRALLERL